MKKEKKAIVFYKGKEREINFSGGLTGHDVVKKIGQSPDNIIIIRDRRPIPIDEEILDGDRIKLIPVFSRG